MGEVRQGQSRYALPQKMEIFFPFVLYVDSILVKEALVVLACLSRLMADKWEIHFARAWLDLRPDLNCGCEVVPPHDPQISPTRTLRYWEPYWDPLSVLGLAQ